MFFGKLGRSISSLILGYLVLTILQFLLCCSRYKQDQEFRLYTKSLTYNYKVLFGLQFQFQFFPNFFFHSSQIAYFLLLDFNLVSLVLHCFFSRGGVLLQHPTYLSLAYLLSGSITVIVVISVFLMTKEKLAYLFHFLCPHSLQYGY